MFINKKKKENLKINSLTNKSLLIYYGIIIILYVNRFVSCVYILY